MDPPSFHHQSDRDARITPDEYSAALHIPANSVASASHYYGPPRHGKSNFIFRMPAHNYRAPSHPAADPIAGIPTHYYPAAHHLPACSISDVPPNGYIPAFHA